MEYYLLFFSILFSAFFSGMEIAFLSSNRLKIELDGRHGSFSMSLVSKLISNPKRYIAAMLIGNNIALVLYSMVMANMLNPILDRYFESEVSVFLMQTVISTLIILLFAEFFPKVVFRNNPNFWLSFFAFPVYIIYVVMIPISAFFIFLSEMILKLSGKSKVIESKHIVFGRVDIDDYIINLVENQNHSDSVINELKLFQNALDFTNVKIRECVIPRTEIFSIDINDTIENLHQLFISSGYSKILVCRDSIDDVLGYAHSKDLFKNPKQIKSIVREVIIVPETMQANKLLSLFIKESKNVAVVVDEFGGTNGMVTIEDILEEILGEINDEHDTDALEERKISNHEFIFSGRLEIDYLNEKYDLDIHVSDEYETIAGFILTHHKNIPKVNDNIEIEDYTFKILKSTQSRIELVQMKINIV